jgi:mRNA deadenylase 3'-5' endonuclease subunit Ccr4
MVLVEHLISPASLPKPLSPLNLSVLSYNVLLPNSVDGWWTYKMYMPPLPQDMLFQASWDYRRGLLKERIQLVNADVVCLQEIAPESFPEDFAFMQDLGYDGVELYKKGRFRPATFWKTSQCELASPAVHKDRCLLTAFKLPDYCDDQQKHHWHVCNCHLQAGTQGGRRVRQIHEAMRGVLTLARKLKGETVG